MDGSADPGLPEGLARVAEGRRKIGGAVYAIETESVRCVSPDALRGETMRVTADPRASASSRNVLRGDVFGGVAAGVVALPLALAFGVASGLGPAAGLYGAIATGLIAAVFGGTPVQITGPTGPMTLVVAGVVATHTLPSGAVDLPRVVGIIVLAGLLQIASRAVPGRRLHPLRALPRHLRVYERYRGDHHPSAAVPDAGRGAAVCRTRCRSSASCPCWAATSNGALLPYPP